MKLVLALLLIVAIFAYNMYRTVYKLNYPKTYDELLEKLSVMTKKGYYEIFVIAAKESRIPNSLLERDWNIYKRKSEMPKYLIDFLEEGKEIILKATVLPRQPF